MWSVTDYGDTHAELYDELMDQYSDADQTVQCLVNAGHRSILEFGSGTGRLAIPLADAGLAVTGIEASLRMIELMAAKAGDRTIDIREGDFTTCRLGGRFDAVLLSRNTLLALPDQELQVAAIANAARHLTASGALYVDLGMPEPNASSALAYGGAIKQGIVFIQRSQRRLQQEVRLNRIVLTDGPPRLLSSLSRYIWPAELDLMARLAGMQACDRWEDWTGAPVVASSPSFVTVYKAQTAAD